MNVLCEENRTKIGFRCFNNSYSSGRAEESQAQNYECTAVFRASHVSVKEKNTLKFSPGNCTQRTKSHNTSSLCGIYFGKTILTTDNWNAFLAINAFWRMVVHVAHWQHKKEDKNEGENIGVCGWYYLFLYGTRKMHTWKALWDLQLEW